MAVIERILIIGIINHGTEKDSTSNHRCTTAAPESGKTSKADGDGG
jgi:hypothetical protein